MPSPTSPVVRPIGEHTVVVNEHVLLSLNIDAANVDVVTTFELPPIQLSEIPPDVKAACSPAKTWTFSGQHETGGN
jgi:hypothetical protein